MSPPRKQHEVSFTMKEFTPSSADFTVSAVFTDVRDIRLVVERKNIRKKQ